jgi:hypothetical protein
VYIMQAIAADSRNLGALKNMGIIPGKEGDSMRALYYPRCSNECDPQDPQTVYGLAFAYMVLGDMGRPRSISKRRWRWRHPRSSAVWPDPAIGFPREVVSHHREK